MSAPNSLRQFAEQLKRLPTVVGEEVAEAAAPKLTSLGNESFEKSENPYGVPWKPGKDGQRVTLDRTGSLKKFIQYVAVGRRLRVALGVAYAKYQVGRRQVLPSQTRDLPESFVKVLQRVAVDVVRKHFRA